MLSASDIRGSPIWFPLRFAGNGVDLWMIRLDEAGYREASFLDDRVLASKPAGTPCPTPILAAAAAQLRTRAHYIFHTGHVGSTLVSRLIGARPEFFSLREPALLRSVAGYSGGQSSAPQGAVSLDVLLPLLSRTWRPNQRAVIKATSIVNEIAASLLGGKDPPRAIFTPRAIFMYAMPLNYLRGIFGGPNSRIESKSLAPSRLRRLTARLGGAGWHRDPRSEGEEIAMNWLCEMTTLHQAALQFPSQVLWVDFDALLAERVAGLDAIMRTLGATPAQGEIEALVSGPLMKRYSKAPEHPYDAELRLEVLSTADSDHRLEIRRGLKWLESVAQGNPLARAVLESALTTRSGH